MTTTTAGFAIPIHYLSLIAPAQRCFFLRMSSISSPSILLSYYHIDIISFLLNHENYYLSSIEFLFFLLTFWYFSVVILSHGESLVSVPYNRIHNAKEHESMTVVQITPYINFAGEAFASGQQLPEPAYIKITWFEDTRMNVLVL